MLSALILIIPYIFLVNANERCLDFTVAACVIDPGLLLWEKDQVVTSTLCQFACHTFHNCKVFRFFQGKCQLFREDFKTSCGVVAGRADNDLDDCILGDVTAGACDGFNDEECEYRGGDTGFSAPPGELTNARECQNYCKGFQVLGCEYWVWRADNKSCNLLTSSSRVCRGISGPAEPELEECDIKLPDFQPPETSIPNPKLPDIKLNDSKLPDIKLNDSKLPEIKLNDSKLADSKLACQEKEQFRAVESVNLQPLGNFAHTFTHCNASVVWNMTAGEDGSEIWRPDNDCGGIALGSDKFQDVEFTGSLTNLNGDGDDDWIGFVFGYQDPGHFYIVLAPQVAVPNNYHNDTWRLTKVSSETANSSEEMILAIISQEDVEGQTTVLMKPSLQGWVNDKVYSWTVKHQPSTKSLYLAMEEDSKPLWSHEWDHEWETEGYTGRVGVFANSQPSRFFNMETKKLCPQ